MPSNPWKVAIMLVEEHNPLIPKSTISVAWFPTRKQGEDYCNNYNNMRDNLTRALPPVLDNEGASLNEKSALWREVNMMEMSNAIHEVFKDVL